MFDRQISGYAALQPGAVLTPFSYEQAELKSNEVRIDISHCGICGSDLQAIDDVYSVFEFPFIPGHEVVGIISEVGSEVPVSRLGERVGIGWQARACGHCTMCLSGNINLCLDVVNNGSWTPYGGFSNSIVVQQEFAYLLPDDMPAEIAAVLMCAGITVYAALSRHFTSVGQKIGIVGIGGLGHLALQFAKAMGYEVTAISRSPQKQAEAFSFGASHYIYGSDKTALKQAEGTFDLLLITSHGNIFWDHMLDILKRKGKIILVAFPEVNFSPVDLVVHELSIVGSFVGTPTEMREMLAFAAANQIKPMVELMPMSQINQAIEKVRQNKARYRIVLVNDLK